MVAVKQRDDGTPVLRERAVVTVLHTDIMGDDFWAARPQLLAP